jgi:hypothetical protein
LFLGAFLNAARIANRRRLDLPTWSYAAAFVVARPLAPK